MSAPACALAAAHFPFQVLHNRLEELLGRHPGLVGADQQRQILGHLALLDGLDADPLQRFGELRHLGRVVELAAMLQAAGPGEDRLAIGLVLVGLPCWCMR